MAAAGITVTIDGDASGLVSAAAEASAALNELSSLGSSLGSEALSITIEATDNATPAIESASAALSAMPADHNTVLNAQDNVTMQAMAAAAAVNAVPLSHNTDLNAVDNASATAASVAAAIESIPSSKTVTINIVTNGSVPKIAKGTRDFEGGLAMVNDQTGIADPRELIVHDGMAYMYEGRNVIAPIPRHARVYTASQTKAIMSGLGIPHFAGGYYPPEFQFLIGEDIREIVQRLYDEEYSTWMYGNDHMSMNGGQVVLALENTDFTGLSETEKESLIREKLDQKKKELEGSFANRWGLNFETEASYYNPTDAAIDRMNLSSELIANQEELLEGYIDLAEQEKSYGDVLSHTSTLIDTRLERVNALNQANAEMRNEMEYLQNSSGYEGIQSWTDELGNATEEYYAFLNSLSTQEEQDKAESYFNDIQKYQQKIIANTEEIRDLTNDISSMRLELNSQKFELWERDFENWTQMHEVYGDWEDVGDSLSQSYARAIERQREFFEAGIIGWQDYHDNVFEYSLEMYKAASDEYDEMLAEQSEYINKMQDEFSKQEEELRTSWEVEDRGADLDEVNRLLAIYDNSVTDTGRQKYKDLLEQKKQLEREEKLYQLQVRNNAVLEQLRAEYDVMEENKKAALSGLRMTGDDIASSNAYISDTADDIRSLAAAIGVQYSAAADSTLNTLEDIYQLLSSIKNVLGIRGGNSQTYNDSRTINVSSGLSENSVRAIINGTVLSGLADFIY